MNRLRGPGLVFIGVGIAFLAIGASGRRAFLFIGLAFVVIGIISWVRTRHTG